ncbi:MAG: helix-turn-helix domain-containing protein [Sphaerochaeta sp.]|uniref:helix-turn-helix domain-containing protein n=1 Tax=Sphaerochaeta sp. TaxID=1972642 RepID=UPI002FC84CEA
MELSEIGLTIKRIRLAQEMTQEDLIERADLSRSQLYYIESGKRLPNFRTMINICMALGLTFKEFVDEWYQ